MPSRISTGKIIEKGFKFLIDAQSVAGAIRKLKIPKMPGKFAAKRAEIRRVAAIHLLSDNFFPFPSGPPIRRFLGEHGGHGGKIPLEKPLFGKVNSNPMIGAEETSETNSR